MKSLVIVGAGGHGKVVADTAREMNEWGRIVFVDQRYPRLSECGTWKVIACNACDLDKSYSGADFVVAIGDNSLRLKLFEEALSLGFNPVNIIHPFSYVSSDLVFGLGVVVFAGAVINVGAKIGKGVIVNTGATVDHDCTLGDGVHVSPGANLSGGVYVGQRSWLGVGCSIKQLISIGDDVVVGAGATVVSDVADKTRVVGTPAKELLS